MNKMIFTTDFAASKFAVTDNPSGLKSFSGYAIVWNQLSSDRGGYKARLLSNSAQIDANANIMALYNHEGGKILASTNAGTLKMTTDAYGLKVEIMPKADTTHYRDTLALVDAGEVKGMSFAMIDPVNYKDIKEGDQRVREFSSFYFDEVTICGAPAFDGTSIRAFADKPFDASTPERIKAEMKIEGFRIESLNI